MYSVANLVLIGRVERDLGHFFVFVPHGFDRATGELDALQKGRLGSIAGYLALQDGQGFLTGLKHSAVAQSCNASQRYPRGGAFVEGGACMRIGGWMELSNKSIHRFS